MLRLLAVISTLLSVSVGLTCYKCAIFPEDMTSDAEELIGSVLTTLSKYSLTIISK